MAKDTIPKREYEFRFWNKKTKTMEYVDQPKTMYTRDMDDIIPMQYTGTLGEGDVKIFEMDIIKRLCNSPTCPIEHLGVVYFDEETAQYMIFEPTGWSAPLIVGHIGVSIMGITKLGNIYENPQIVEALKLIT